MARTPPARVAAAASLLTIAAHAPAHAYAQTAEPPAPGGEPVAVAPAADTAAELRTLDVDACLADGVRLLLGMQETLGGDAAEGPALEEWPYEGVHRVRRQIPIGYRVGGTSICATALLEVPGWRDDAARREAIHRAAAFVCRQVEHPEMQFPYPPAYDVRGWGYAYGLDFLLRLEQHGELPASLTSPVADAIDFYLDGLLEIEVPGGGWNYALASQRTQAPFMTGPVLRALFRAAASGRAVPADVIERGLASLESSRMASGSFVYSGRATERSRDGVPGAMGRMLAADTALALAGRGDVDRLRFGVDAFFEHWDELEKRRRQNGTHAPPYGVAPYYFFYAHHAAALAIELLPEDERASYRARLHDRLAVVREPDGSWNDRVFERSANYGTAMTLLALRMPDGTDLPTWRADDVKPPAEPAEPADPAAPSAPATPPTPGTPLP